MKNLKKVLALVLAVVMIMGVVSVASAKTYTDVKGTDNYANAIDALSSLNILDGFKDGDNYSFKADETFTRAQAAKIVAIVHNAATNGKIKDQDAISALYSNAQNPFVDCNSSWALPFINYCRITGLADGMTATTYEPNRYVTGVQFLKLMLTTLNFDTNKEGYTGTGWDINVLNRANEIGLTAGLADDWKAIAPIKRGEAAQILYNALQAYLVEYGQKVKNTYVEADADKETTAHYAYSFISNEQVAQSGYTLGAKMGIKMTKSHDVFMRPGVVWSYGTWSAFYLNAAKLTYTSKVTACDVLVDLGIKKTSKDSITYIVYRDGRAFMSNNGNGLTTMDHNDATVCEGTTLGGNGALTQVYKMSYKDGDKTKTAYVITVIDTFLGKVTGLTSSKHGDISKIDSSNVTLWTAYPTSGDRYTNRSLNLTVKDLVDYAKNDYVLFNASVAADDKAATKWYGDMFGYGTLYGVDTKIYNNQTKYVYAAGSVQAGNVYVVDVQKAGLIENATFSGQDYKGDTLTVNGTRTPANATYTLTGIFTGRYGQYWPNDIKNGTKVTSFFTDQYDNVIGDYTTASTKYAVIDSIMWVNDGGLQAEKYAEAALVGTDAQITYAKVNKYDSKSVTAVTQGVLGLPGGTPDATVAQDAINNAKYVSEFREYGVVSYTVDADGKYALTSHIGLVGTAEDNEIKAGQVKFGTVETKGTVYASNDTQFVVRTKVAGKYVYTNYAGINAIPTMSNVGAIVAVYDNATDNYASFIFVMADNAIFAGSDTVAFVTNTTFAYAENGVSYYYDVYVNGEKVTIEAQITAVNNAENLFANGTGLYTLHFGSEDKKVTSATKIAADASWKLDYIAKTDVEDETAALTLTDGTGINLTNAKVYVVSDGVVTVGDLNSVAAGDTVSYKLVEKSTYMVEMIFVIKA